MKIRASIFDLYGTLLEVGPGPADAETLWVQLWQDRLGTPARLNLAQFSALCGRIIEREQAAARARGIPHPEVSWPEVACGALPELRRLPPEARDEFLFRQSQLWHSPRLAPEAADTLRALRSRGILLGLASNAQAYTVRELREALATQSLELGLFEPDLCFWSFQHGFSKPDPHVFQILTARLAERGLQPAETLMVGDRLDNDIEPARAHGWQVWHLGSGGDGGWADLRERLGGP